MKNTLYRHIITLKPIPLSQLTAQLTRFSPGDAFIAHVATTYPWEPSLAAVSAGGARAFLHSSTAPVYGLTLLHGDPAVLEQLTEALHNGYGPVPVSQESLSHFKSLLQTVLREHWIGDDTPFFYKTLKFRVFEGDHDRYVDFAI